MTDYTEEEQAEFLARAAQMEIIFGGTMARSPRFDDGNCDHDWVLNDEGIVARLENSEAFANWYCRKGCGKVKSGGSLGEMMKRVRELFESK